MSHYRLDLLKTKQKASTDSLSLYYFLSSQPKTNRVVCMYIGLSFPGGSVIKNPPANEGNVGKIPWRRKWQPTPVFLLGKSHGQRSLVDYSPWGRKESNTTKGLNKNNNNIHWLHTNFSHFILALPPSTWPIISAGNEHTQFSKSNRWLSSLILFNFSVANHLLLTLSLLAPMTPTPPFIWPLTQNVLRSQSWLLFLFPKQTYPAHLLLFTSF